MTKAKREALAADIRNTVDHLNSLMEQAESEELDIYMDMLMSSGASVSPTNGGWFGECRRLNVDYIIWSKTITEDL